MKRLRYFYSGRLLQGQTSNLPPRTHLLLPISVPASTACPSPLSLLRRAPGSSPPALCVLDCGDGWPGSPVGLGTRVTANRPCELRSTGATTCSMQTSRWCSHGWPCSPVAAPWRQQMWWRVLDSTLLLHSLT